MNVAKRLPIAAKSTAGIGRCGGPLGALSPERGGGRLPVARPSQACAIQRVACGAATLVPLMELTDPDRVPAARIPRSTSESSQHSIQSGPVGAVLTMRVPCDE